MTDIKVPQGQKIVSFSAVVTRANGRVENLGLIDHSHAYLLPVKLLKAITKVPANLERLFELRRMGAYGATIIPTGSASIDGGKAVFAGLVEAAGGNYISPKYIAFGQGNPTGTRITALVTDLALSGEIGAPGGVNLNTGQSARITGTPTQVTTTNSNDTMQVVGTITAGTALAIVEASLNTTSAFPYTSTVATQGVLSGTGTGTFTVTSSTNLPTASTNYQIDSEVFTGTSSGTTITITARGVNGSSAVSHANGSNIQACSVTGTGAAGLMAAKGDFAVINLATNDTLQLTAKIQFT